MSDRIPTGLFNLQQLRSIMEIIYKVSMKSMRGSKWMVMDSGDEAAMRKELASYREAFRHAPAEKFRLEKHTMEVVE